MQKTKLFFVPLVLAALFLWATVPAPGQALVRSERSDRSDRSVRSDQFEHKVTAQDQATQQHKSHLKQSGTPLCNVFTSHPFFVWLTPFSWCNLEDPDPQPEPNPDPEPEPDPEPKMFSISGMKFNDENGNGILNEDEQGMENWTITAVNASGTLAVSTTTGPDGTYEFAVLPPHMYTICEEQQTGWTQTFPIENNGCYILEISTTDFSAVNFGNMQNPDLEPEPVPGIDHLLISEVYYDIDDTHGTESSNEWIEIYNGTGTPVDLTDWSIQDADNHDTIASGTILADDSFAIVTRDETTALFWTWPLETAVILIGGPLGNGLGNTGDALYLKNSEGATVDAVSWGSNIDAFDPSVSGVAEGSSIERADLTTDTDTAADWAEQMIPAPGE